MSGHVIGVDIGGTFTDTVIWRSDGTVAVGKAFTTYSQLGDGLHESVNRAAESLGESADGVLSKATALVHGTTVGTNALVQRSGARVGLLCTAGHRDVLGMMRAAGRVAGQPVEQLLDVARATKPAPLVPRAAIIEIPERTTAKGQVVVELDEAAVSTAVETLRSQGCEAVAISFLWSTANASNERRCLELVRQRWPEVYVCTSHEIAPRIGEYERTAATVINAYVGPTLSGYLGGLRESLRYRHFGGELRIMTCAGGVIRPEAALERPGLTIGSGPAAGVLACEQLARQRGDSNAIASDMGGTTFDAALLTDGRVTRRQTAIVDQYEYYVETIDVQSIGAGGGSIARVLPDVRALRVGPTSAGSEPGPVCYGRGGTEPTVTDADLVLGLISPDTFLGGEVKLDRDAAERALARLGQQLGMTAIEVAAGIGRIADERMADLIRRMTIQRGFDPRGFSVYAYGGAGPVHVGAYARALGAARAVVPLGAASSVWSAFGAAAADVAHNRFAPLLMREPFDEEGLRRAFAQLEGELQTELDREGFGPDKRRFDRLVEVRFSAQVHTLEVPLDDPADRPSDWAGSLADRFERMYESRYGRGTGYRKAGVEISAIKVIATGDRSLPSARSAPGAVGVSGAGGADREIYWHEIGEALPSAIVAYGSLRAGDRLDGPAVIDVGTTAIVVRPGQAATLDEFGNVVIDLDGSAQAAPEEKPDVALA